MVVCVALEEMLPEADIIIAGGGPGGLAAAETAARRGAGVAVFERNSEIGSPTRTSGGSFVQDMAGFGIPERLYHQIHKCRFLSPKSAAEFSHPDPIACVIDVRGVYQHLAERAIAAIGRDAVVLQDRRVYRELFNLNTSTKVMADPAKRRAS